MRVVGSAAMVLVLSGCVAPMPTDEPRGPDETNLSAASATASAPAPTPEVGIEAPLETIATVTRDDVRMTLKLDAAPLRAGNPGWATVRIENVGDDVVRYRTDGCEVPAHVSAWMVGDWIAGREQAGIAGEFKAAALDRGSSHLAMSFEPDQFAGHDFACTDVGVVNQLGARAVVEQRSVWLGWDGAPIPDSPVEIVAAFPFLGRGPNGPEEEIQPVEVRLAASIVGGDPWPWMTPAQAIDAALADPEFRDWVVEFPSESWVNPTTTLDSDAGTWQVGLIRDAPGRAMAQFLTLDARTGGVIRREYR